MVLLLDLIENIDAFINCSLLRASFLSKLNQQEMMSKIISSFSTAAAAQASLFSSMHHFTTGHFPHNLLYSRPFQLSTTKNGIRVATEQMQSHIASISVFINCGSRNQTQSTSGTAHFLQHLHFKGTKNRSRQRLELQVENMGGTLNAYTSRQNTSYMMTVFKNDVGHAISILGDMLTNSLYNQGDVNRERSTIKRELIQTRLSQPLQSTIQIAHRGVFRGHQMALPILGNINNMETISKKMIEDYHNDNYVGQNIIVVAEGDIDHEKLVQFVEKEFTMDKKSKNPRPQLIKPIFSPGFSTQESDNDLVNMVAIHQAPSFFDNQFFCYLLLQRIIADRPENQFELQIMKNSTSFRYQKMMSKHDWIYKQKGFYSSYWDAGLYGNYFLVPPEKCFQTIRYSMEAYKEYADSISDEELQRAKRRVYVQVMQHESQNDLTQSIANNILYYDRRVHTKEVAERVACITKEQIGQIVKQIIKPEKMHVTCWGNVKNIKFK